MNILSLNSYISYTSLVLGFLLSGCEGTIQDVEAFVGQDGSQAGLEFESQVAAFGYLETSKDSPALEVTLNRNGS